MSKKNDLIELIDALVLCNQHAAEGLKSLLETTQGIMDVLNTAKEELNTENSRTVLSEKKTGKKDRTAMKEEPPHSETSCSNTKENNDSEKKYTKEEIRGILSRKSAAGHGCEVKALLKEYGADKLSALDPKDYAAVAKKAEEIGNA